MNTFIKNIFDTNIIFSNFSKIIAKYDITNLAKNKSKSPNAFIIYRKEANDYFKNIYLLESCSMMIFSKCIAKRWRLKNNEIKTFFRQISKELFTQRKKYLLQKKELKYKFTSLRYKNKPIKYKLNKKVIIDSCDKKNIINLQNPQSKPKQKTLRLSKDYNDGIKIYLQQLEKNINNQKDFDIEFNYDIIYPDHLFF
jgi:hypothetical protein